MTHHDRLFAKYATMTSPVLRDKIIDLRFIVDALLEYIDALPDDVVGKLPAMPGIDRDHIDYVLE